MSKKVVIDAGHGGIDGGANNNGILEKEYTLKISKYISDRLNDLGIENSLSRTTDELLDQTTRPKRIQNFYGNGNDVVVISNHLNAGGGDGRSVILRHKYIKIIIKYDVMIMFNIIETFKKDSPSFNELITKYIKISRKIDVL